MFSPISIALQAPSLIYVRVYGLLAHPAPRLLGDRGPRRRACFKTGFIAQVKSLLARWMKLCHSLMYNLANMVYPENQVISVHKHTSPQVHK